MYKQANNASMFLFMQTFATAFFVLLFAKYLFLEQISSSAVEILGVFQELLTIPAILITLLCFMLSIIYLFIRKDYSNKNIWLFSICLVTIIMLTYTTVKDF